ncbi:hypothetical protein LOTGIDRAFT_165691 [Lottia gigantea]|uniref:Uncharacterized protein n=1 Tax=Lottia gigantea TaxID=225164 RepID=V4A4R2_LOTGI|nr:hypothetical protein LOTGIDRAFT_165691 [Lottia gigantea]ESO88256.1 hypothetical protein LOTGIDRAFT_165691 [Lottia gigantea]
MIETEVLCLMNELLDRCELMLDINTSETTKLSQKQNSNSSSLFGEQVAEDAQSPDIPENLAEIIQDESNETELISYRLCEAPLFSDSEDESSKILVEEINNKSENLKLSTHIQSYNTGNFPSLKLAYELIHNNFSPISNFKEVSSESDLLNLPHLVEVKISDVQEIKGKMLDNHENDWNGYKKFSKSNSNLLVVEQVTEDHAQLSDIPVNVAEVIEDDSKSYILQKEQLFSDSEDESSKIIKEQINDEFENLNVSQISNFKEVCSESDQLNSSVHEEAEISNIQEINGKKLKNHENDWNGYNHRSLPEEAIKIILPDVQNAIKLCTTGNSNTSNKNIDLLGQVKSDYSVKALVPKTDCWDIASEIQSETQQGNINLPNLPSNINGMDTKDFVENAKLLVDTATAQEICDPVDTDHYSNESSNFEEVFSKTFSVNTIIDGYLDDVPTDVSSEQIVLNASNPNYFSLFDKSITKTEEISENVIMNDKQELEAMNDVKICKFLNGTEVKFEDNKEPLIKYEIDTNAENMEQLFIDSQNADADRGCKIEEIDIETKASYNNHKTKVVSSDKGENKKCFEAQESLEQLNDDIGTWYLKAEDCCKIKFADQNLNLTLNEVQTTECDKSFMEETEVNEKCTRGEISRERSNCKNIECAWNNAEWKINDTLADKESCTKVNRCSDIHRSKSQMKLNSTEMFHKNVEIFQDNDSSILEDSLYDEQKICNEQLSTLMHDSNLCDNLFVLPFKHLSNSENDSKFMNTSSDTNIQNSQEYKLIPCAQAVFQDISVINSSGELESGDQVQENKSKELFNDSFKSPSYHISQVAKEATNRETTVVKSDVYRSKVETPDVYIDLEEDLEDILMYPATQCFKPSIRPSEVIGDRAETNKAYQSDNMNVFELDDVKVPDIYHKRNISQVYLRNQDASEIKKSRKGNSQISNPCFKWNQTVPISADIKGEEVISMKPMVTCSRPLRLGLSKKQKTKTLHRN